MKHAIAESLFCAVVGIALIVATTARAQGDFLEERWATSAGLSSPESAYWDAASGRLFVSNMAGGPVDRNGQGFIQELSSNGKVVTPAWVAGLNSPKGLKGHEGTLWVTAIDEVVGIRIADGRIVKRVPIPGAQCLNDLEIAPDGTLFVSDIFANRILAIHGETVSVYAEGEDLESPNGLHWHQGRLLAVGSNIHVDGKVEFEKSPKQGHLYAIDPVTRKPSRLHADALGMLDAIETDDAGNFLVSDWLGSRIFRIHPRGGKDVLLSAAGNTADFTYVPGKNLLVVPLLGANTVKAYRIVR